MPALMLGCTSRLDPDLPSPPSLSSQSTARAVTSKPRPAPSPILAPTELRKYCHSGDPLVGVYSPWRLSVKSPCAAVTGVVADTNIEHDGDLHISLADVDPSYLNAVNLRRAHQDLVVEAVPALPMARPAVGARITVIGPWVLDTQTGWLEIHPVWTILPAE
jgi:hypothetical protein